LNRNINLRTTLTTLDAVVLFVVVVHCVFVLVV
jgi:hypothetical protein